MGPTWSEGLLSALPTLALVGGMMIGFWRFVRTQTTAIVNETAVTRDSYKEDQATMWGEINQMKKLSAEFGILNEKVDNLKEGQLEQRSEIKDLRKEIKNGLDGVFKAVRENPNL